MSSNPAPFTAASPGPAHVPPTTNEDLRVEACGWMDWGVAHRGHFTYTERPNRGHMFDSKPGTLPQWADCSQFATSVLHWSGVKHGLDHAQSPLTNTDYTGTLLQKGRHVTVAQVRHADVVIYGPGTGTHAAMIRERVSETDFWTVGFGHPGGPDRVLHSVLARWFADHGHPGVTFLAFLL